MRPVLLVQHLGHRAPDGLMHVSLAGEPDLVFSRMDIDVHCVAGHIDENSGHRELTLDQPLGIAFKQCMLDDPVAHKPAVDININCPGRTTGHTR